MAGESSANDLHPNGSTAAAAAGAIGRRCDNRYFAFGIGAAGGGGVTAGPPGCGAGLAVAPNTGGAGAATWDSRGSGTGAGAPLEEGCAGVGTGGACAPSGVAGGAAVEAETRGRARSSAPPRACDMPPSPGCRPTLTADDAAGAAPVLGGPSTVTAIVPLSVLTTKL